MECIPMPNETKHNCIGIVGDSDNTDQNLQRISTMYLIVVLCHVRCYQTRNNVGKTKK